MATIRFKDKEQIATLSGNEVLLGTSINGGASKSGQTIAPGADIAVRLSDISNFKNRVVNLTSSSGVLAINLALADYFTCTLTENITSITYSNVPPAGSFSIRFKQGSSGGYTLTHPSSHKAIGGSDTTLQTASGAFTMVVLTTFDGGTRWEYSMKACAA